MFVLTHIILRGSFMSHLLAEHRLSVTDLAHREAVAPSTVWRWALRGCRGARLETFSVGAKRFTTLEAFARFVDATTAAANGEAVQSRTNCQRAASVRRAEEALAEAGI
jgi:hypothetical protein